MACSTLSEHALGWQTTYHNVFESVELVSHSVVEISLGTLELQVSRGARRNFDGWL